MFKINLDLAEKSAFVMLQSLGLNLKDENYKNTPKRMVKVLAEFTESLRSKEDLAEDKLEQYFGTVFPKHNDMDVSYKGMLIQNPIRVYSMCSHHILPVVYDISFAYIPKDGRSIGFSKITRIIYEIAKRPMNQEDFTQEIISVFKKGLQPNGIAVVVSGVHMCMKMRGISSDSVNITSSVSGDFEKYEKTRLEFFSLVKRSDTLKF